MQEQLSLDAAKQPATRALGFIERWLEVTAFLRGRWLTAIAVALSISAISTAARVALDPVLPPGFPFLTYFPAVIVSAFLGGAISGVICAALCGLAAWRWFILPAGEFNLDPHVGVALSLYAFVVTVEIALIHFMTMAVDHLQQEREETQRLLERQKTLYSELQHRVANNLAFVSALFGMQKRKLAGNPEAVAAFDDARLRLDTMGRVHRRLYDSANAALPLEAFLRELLRDAMSGAGVENVRTQIEIEPIALPNETVISLALVVMEAATNSLKHAFHERGGVFSVRLARMGDGRARLTIRDDGPGWPEGGPNPESKSLGLRIIKSFAANLHAELGFGNDGGAVMTLTFPLPEAA